MKKGDIVEIKIDDMNGEGQGIGKADGFVVFVPGAVVGDTVTAELTKVKKRYGFSRLVELLQPSVHRNGASDCPYLEAGCGGCPYGRLDYDAQLGLKERQVTEKLRRLAGVEDPLVRPIIGMEDDDNDGSGAFRYRDKAQFPVSTGGVITRKGGVVENLGEPAVGFFRAKSHDVVDCGDCLIQSLPAMAAADALRRFMAEDNITAWDPKWEKGLMRRLIVRTGFATGEVMVILVINGNGVPNAQKLVEMMDDAIYDTGYSLESVVVSVKKGKEKDDHDIMGDRNMVIAGKPVINDRLGDLEIEISPASFYQVNPVQMKRLYDKVREYCGFDVDGGVDNGIDGGIDDGCAVEDAAGEKECVRTDSDEHMRSRRSDGFSVGRGCPDKERMDSEKPVVLDIYCGVGTVGLYCADSAEMVVGIESVKDAVVDANRNAVINGIVNARYICGRAEEVLPACAAAGFDGCPDEEADDLPDGEVKDAGKGGLPEGVDPELAEAVKRADIAILDPPRAGCRPELLQAVAEVGVGRIVYVSCDPATLARDIKLLGEMGYEFVEATPVDMFPHTGHVETVVLMSRVKD